MIYKSDLVEKIILEEKRGLFVDLGSEKIRVILSLIDRKFELGIRKILVIMAKGDSFSNWENEIAKWKNLSYLQDYLGLYYKDQEEPSWPRFEDPPIYFDVVPLEKFALWAMTHVHSIQGYDLVIISESTDFKDEPLLSDFSLSLVVAPPAEAFYISNSPLPNIQKIKTEELIHYNNGNEFFYLFHLFQKYIDYSEMRIDEEENFIDQYCFDKIGDRRGCYLHEHYYDYLKNKIARLALVEKWTSDFLISEEKVYCQIDNEQFSTLIREFKNRTYNFWKRTYNLKMISTDDKEQLIRKMMQLTNGFIEDENNEIIRLNTHKFTKLQEILKKTTGNVLICYGFKEDGRFLLENLEGAVLLKDKNDFQAWTDGKIKYGLFSPTSTKSALKLSGGGQTIIWYGLTWGKDNFDKVNQRLILPRQKTDIDIYYLLGEKSLDDYVYNAVFNKNNSMRYFISFLKTNF